VEHTYEQWQIFYIVKPSCLTHCYRRFEELWYVHLKDRADQKTRSWIAAACPTRRRKPCVPPANLCVDYAHHGPVGDVAARPRRSVRRPCN